MYIYIRAKSLASGEYIAKKKSIRARTRTRQVHYIYYTFPGYAAAAHSPKSEASSAHCQRRGQENFNDAPFYITAELFFLIIAIYIRSSIIIIVRLFVILLYNIARY